MVSKKLLRHRRERGFSLVELMVVITIIGLLASIVGANVYWYLKEAKVSTAKTQMLQIEQAIDSFRTIKSRLPDSLDELIGDDTPWGDRPIPQDPWGGEYMYQKESRKNYTLVSLGADGLEGGEGEEADIDRESLRKNDTEEQ